MTSPPSEGTDNDEKAGAKGFVDLFIQERLLVADTDPQGEVTVSVAHEALLREWQRVKEWLTENREFLRMRDRLDSSLKLWLSRGKQRDDLLGRASPWRKGRSCSKTLDRRLAVNRLITSTRALPSETGEGRPKRGFVTRSWPRLAFWQSLLDFSGCRPSASVRAPRRTQRWPELKKHARSKPWHRKHRSL